MANLIERRYAKMANIELTKNAKMIDYWYMNKLPELRKKNGLTQKEAALLVGIPYRTYVRYEENHAYENSFKYHMIFDALSNKLRIDEEHGILSVSKIKELLIPILVKHNISYCYLFGSYARGEARDNSDIDLLVDTDISGMAFFRLVDEIRDALHKKIDLLALKDLSDTNPINKEILKDGIRLI